MAMIDSARLAMLALPNYVREEMKPPTRKSYILREIKNRGRETYGNGGDSIQWRPEKRRHDLTWGPGNPNVVTFPQINLWGSATLQYKTCWMGASLSEIEMLALQDAPARFFKKIMDVGKRAAEDFPIRFAPHLYDDGTGTQKIEGFQSFGSVSAADTYEPIGLPNDTYAGVSTALGSEGDWSAPASASWPRVGSDPDSCDFEYYYFSQLHGDYNHSTLPVDSTTETASWDDCWIYAMRYITTHAGILTSEVPDVWMTDPDLLRRAENSLKKDQQFQLAPDAQGLDAGVRVVQFEGIKFASEFGVPAGLVQGVKFSQLELKCMGSEFIKTDEDRDIRTGDKLYRLSWHGNLWCSSPIHFPALTGVSTEGT